MPSVAYMYTPVQVGIWSVCSTFRRILILTPLLLWGMNGLTRDETAEPASREQVFRYAGAGTMSGRQKSCSKYLPCSADHEKDCGIFYTPGWSILGYKCECYRCFQRRHASKFAKKHFTVRVVQILEPSPMLFHERKNPLTHTVFYSSTESYENERSSLEGRKSNEGERGGKDIFAFSRTNLFWRGVVELFFG